MEFILEFGDKNKVTYRWGRILVEFFLLIDCYSLFIENYLILIKNLKKSINIKAKYNEKFSIKTLIYAEKNLSLKLKIFFFASRHEFAKINWYNNKT